MWVSESEDPSRTLQILAITDKSLYWVQTGNWANVTSQQGAESGAHEEFFEIVSYDVSQNHISLLKRWTRNDGLFGGFDFPQWSLTYAIEGDRLRIGMSDGTEFPADVTSETYYRR